MNADGAVPKAGRRDPVPDKAVDPGRARSAWLANKRQELLAPISAVIDLSDMLLKDARKLGHAGFTSDLEKIHASGQHLLAMVNEVLDPAKLEADGDLAKRVRHDLRTPLNHILGYSEMWLEDADELPPDAFVAELQQIHELGKKLLVCIEDILGFTKAAGDTSKPVPSPELSEMIRHTVGSLPARAAEGGPNHGSDKGAILVVDDNPINRDILVRRLTREGHTVTVACNGREALDLVRSRPFDLILLDLIMPELNGFQVLAQLKADDRLRHIPVIMISALDDIDGVAHCIEMGAEDYLPKPFNPVLLRARIGACLEKKRFRDKEVCYLEQIQEEKKRADELLHVILPGEIVKELKATNAVKSRRYENVAVMFCDIVGFTPFCDRSQPEEVVQHLQHLIEMWEEIALQHGVEKIKTIGDAFMAAAGLLRKTEQSPVLNCIRCGLDMIAATRKSSASWNIRVGIHAGPVVAGVIGRRQYLFDLWGDTVNTAARMESHGVPGAVTLSGEAWKQVAHRCQGESLGITSVKGKGQMEMIRFDRFVDQ